MRNKTTTDIEQLSLLGLDEELTSDHPHAEGLSDVQLACRADGHSYPDRKEAKYFIDRDRSVEAGQLLARKDWHCQCGVVKSFWITVPNGHAYGRPRLDYSEAEGYLQGPDGELARKANYRREQVGRDLGTRTMNTYKRRLASQSLASTA